MERHVKSVQEQTMPCLETVHRLTFFSHGWLTPRASLNTCYPFTTSKDCGRAAATSFSCESQWYVRPPELADGNGAEGRIEG
jgi:hypothetical protein